MNVRNLIARYPVLFHMAEMDTWPNIKTEGLLSTSAVLDRAKLRGEARLVLEERHRPEKVSVDVDGRKIVLRDQKPMEPRRLERALKDGITPEQWYKLLNGKV